MSNVKKLTDYILVNGEQRFFVASDVTDDLLDKIKEEIQDGGITDIVAGSSNVHVSVSQDGKKATISVDDGNTVVFVLDESSPEEEWIEPSYEDIRAAIDAGKVPILLVLVYGGNKGYFELSNDYNSGAICFRGMYESNRLTSYYVSANGWSSDGVSFEKSSNKITSVRKNNASDTRYPSELAVRTAIDEEHIDVDSSLDLQSQNPVENRIVTGAVNEKQDQIPQEQLDEMTDQEIDDLMASLT